MAGILAEAYQTISMLLKSVSSKIVVATIIVLIGFILGKVLGKIIKRALSEIEINKFVRKATKINIAAEEVIGGFVSYAIYFIFIVMALRHIGLATDVLNILAGVVFLVIVLSILLGVKDVIPNIFAGIIIHKRRFLHEGDFIKVGDIEGKVTSMGLAEVMLEAKNGDIIRIPNSVITNTQVRKRKPDRPS